MTGTMGIIGCNSLADEVSYLLNRDYDISQIFIISNTEGASFLKNRLSKSLVDRTCLVDEGDLRLLERTPGLNVILWLLPSSLHEAPLLLQNALLITSIRISCFVDSIFIVHGLCGVSHYRLRDIMEMSHIPITYLTYPNGEVADDCFGSFIGSKEGYLEFIKRNKFALFLTIGFARYLIGKHKNQDIVTLVSEVEDLRFTLKTLGFNKVIKLETEIGDIQEFDSDVNVICKTLDLELERVKCDLLVFDHSYDLGKLSIGLDRPDHSEGWFKYRGSTSDAHCPSNLSVWGLI